MSQQEAYQKFSERLFGLDEGKQLISSIMESRNLTEGQAKNYLREQLVYPHSIPYDQFKQRFLQIPESRDMVSKTMGEYGVSEDQALHYLWDLLTDEVGTAILKKATEPDTSTPSK